MAGKVPFQQHYCGGWQCPSARAAKNSCTEKHGLKETSGGCFMTRWWFQIFFIFIPTWGDDPIWLIFFKWVETTNQMNFLFFYHFFSPKKPSDLYCISLTLWRCQFGGALRLPRSSFSLRLWLATGSKQYTVYILYCHKFCIVHYILCLILWSHILSQISYIQSDKVYVIGYDQNMFNYVDIIQNVCI